MPARDEILHRLRTILARPDLRFPPRETTPLDAETRMAVTEQRGGSPELAARFARELAALHGTSELVESTAEARLALINRLIAWHDTEEAAIKGVRLTTGQEKQVLGWDAQALPLGHLSEALADMGFELVAPKTLATKESREAVRHIRYGLTGVEAAFATTGSLLLAAGGHQLRAASLLPIRHIALVPLSRLYGSIEDWLAAGHHDDLVHFFRSRPNVTLISGPSKSADIEMNLTLGVHGPRFLHCILFDDEAHEEAEDDSLSVGAYRYRLFRDESSSGDAEDAAAHNPKGTTK